MVARHAASRAMAPSARRYCPVCDESTEHRLVAATSLHLGRKEKWRCGTCEHVSVTIDGAVDTAGESADP
ncbi:MAG: hypothetical protein ACOC42_03660 [Halobacteriota archaeon]